MSTCFTTLMFTVLTTSADFADLLVGFLLPVSICLILPCTIVWIVNCSRRHAIDKKTELALKAIENGAQFDPEIFSGKKEKSIKEKIFGNFKSGCILASIGIGLTAAALLNRGKLGDNSLWMQIPGIIFILLGVAYFVAYFIGRKQFAAEISAEEENSGEE
ncbi:MAG: DUF6249 domain-containing protein [Candidatus Cryptobacteroides sp.]